LVCSMYDAMGMAASYESVASRVLPARSHESN